MTVLEDITGRQAPWPPPSHANRLATQHDYSRLYRNRRHEILEHWSADLLRWVGQQDELIPYPAPKLAARTLASFLFGEDPTISHPDRTVRDAISAMSSRHNLPARLLEGGITQAVEGEIYLRPVWDAELDPDFAIPTVVPGSRVIPRFRFGLLVDAAIITEWRPDVTGTVVYRLIEHHERGTITNVLHRGVDDRLGARVPLDSLPATAQLEDSVDTGLDELLMVHVPLARDASSPHGVSLFDGLESLILAMHRLYSQEQHDAEMARRRIALPQSFVGRDAAGRPQWDRRTDLFPLSDEAEGPVGEQGVGVVPIEFSDDLVGRERIRGRLEDFLMACGISPTTVMPDQTGQAASGTARKLAQATTLRTVAATARYWQDAGARFVRLLMDVQRIHLDPDTPELGDEDASVSLSDGLIDDPMELARMLGELDTAEAISTLEKVRTLHPEWDEMEVQEEVDRILDAAPNPPPPPQLGFQPPADDDAPDDDEVDDLPS